MSKGKNSKNEKKNMNWMLPAGGILLVFLIVGIVAVNLSLQGQDETDSGSTDSVAAVVDNGENTENFESDGTMAENSALMIPLSEVTTDVSFYPVAVDGTMLEVMAVKDSSGTIRTAFNTCQVCYDSGYGYYEQEGDHLVCQNCGNQFTFDEIGVEGAGGCNPWPILASNRVVTDDAIEISYAFLEDSKQIFANWKSEY